MNIWLVGSGTMSRDYIKVLNSLNANTTVIGRGENSAQEFTKSTNIPVITGGLDAFLATKPSLAQAAIVSVGVEDLNKTVKTLVDIGVKKILSEKPAGINFQEIQGLYDYAKNKDVEILLGYNRRFYSSVLAAQKMIAEDGGATSFTFEFTEWSHIIEKSNKPKKVFENWLLANSSHVIDMAFFLGGEPKEIACFHYGSMAWHPSASAFTGAGITKANIPFSYHANWQSAGRWSVEVLTRKRRYIFRPLEELHIQELGSVALSKVDIDNKLDAEYKPGLYLQVKNFLEGNFTDFCTLKKQVELVPFYEKIANLKTI